MRTFIEFVDKAFCINLDRRADRWEAVSETFRQVGIEDSIIRFPAITAEDPRVGCLHSHIECVKKGMDEDADNLLVLEDDVVFNDINQEVVEDVVEFLHRDSRWELF
jgi:glycosyl transferase family 25